MTDVAYLMSIYAGDRPDWLAAAIRSVLDQEYAGGAVHLYICADGPLTPELEACLAGFGNRIYRIVRLEKNQGLAVALNRLIAELGSEPYAFRMDADDLCLPRRTALQTAFMESRPDVLLCGGAIQEFRDDPSAPGLLRTYPETTDAMRRYIAKANPFAHSSVCFRRAFFERVGRYNDRLPLRQDIELWFRAVALDVPMSNLREPVLLFRVSDALVRRRGLRVGLIEFRLFMKGLYRLYGIHPLMLWPLLRLVVRIMPPPVTAWIYRRNSRRWLNT